MHIALMSISLTLNFISIKIIFNKWLNQMIMHLFASFLLFLETRAKFEDTIKRVLLYPAGDSHLTTSQLFWKHRSSNNSYTSSRHLNFVKHNHVRVLNFFRHKQWNEPHFKFTIQKRKQINLIFQMQGTVVVIASAFFNIG